MICLSSVCLMMNPASPWNRRLPCYRMPLPHSREVGSSGKWLPKIWPLSLSPFFFAFSVAHYLHVLLFIATLFIYLFIFLAVLGLRFVRGLSPVTASGGHSSSRCGDRSSSRCTGLSPSRPLPPRGTGSRHAGSAVVAHGPSCSAACGILPDQGSNPRPLH